MPDQKRQSLGQWVMLIMLKTIPFFSPKAVDFSLPMHSFGFLIWEKTNWKGASWGDEWNRLPLFSVLIYLLLFILNLLLKLFLVRPNLKWGTDHIHFFSSKSYKKLHCAFWLNISMYLKLGIHCTILACFLTYFWAVCLILCLGQI